MIILSIIVVNWNTRQLLQKCLQAITENIHDINSEIFVVDNGSSDGSQEMVRVNFPQVNLIENTENVGFAKANNQAIRFSKGKYILLLNSDAFLTSHAVQTMVNELDADQNIGITGAKLIYPDGRSQVSYGPLPTFMSEVGSLFGLDKLNKTTSSYKGYEETGVVNGACMLIRRSLLDQIGLLDEEFFMFSEEVDLCKRCHQSGSKVVHIPSAVVIHAHGGSTGLSVQRIKRLYTGKLQYFHKHFGQNTELRLKQMMIIASITKWLFYAFLRVLSLGRIKKDEFWWAVSREVTTIS